MAFLTIKKTNILTATFLGTYFLLDFVGFASILAIFTLWLFWVRRLHVGDVRMAGVPALAAIFLIALLSTFTVSPFPFSAWNTGKDLYFFSSPILILVMGLTFLKSSSDLHSILLTAVKILTLISIVLFAEFLFGGGIFNVSLNTRYTYQLDSTSSTLALLLIISLRPTFGSLTANLTLFSIAIINALLILVSLSRVNLSIAILSLLFIYSNNRLVRIAVVATTILLIAAPLFQLQQTSPIGSTSGAFGFAGKVLNSLQEMSISDYSDFAEINENWRGYEAYLGVNQVLQIGGWANLIGVGFGSFVEGPFEDKLTAIPFFHNGYVTIFLKSGALGIAIFVLFAGRLFVISRSAFVHAHARVDPPIVTASLIILLLTNSLLLRTLSTHGLYYSRPPMELFFIGIAIFLLGNSRRSKDAIQSSRFSKIRSEP